MANTFKVSQSNVFCGLGTVSHTVAATSMYRIKVTTTLPPNSSLSLIIQQNGVTKATADAPTTAEEVLNLQALLSCTAADVISVVLSSSNARDNQLNRTKTTITMYQGQ